MNLTIKRKMVILMGGIAILIPTTLISILAFAYYYLNIDALFDKQISNAVAHTVKIAQLYLEEHKGKIKMDALFVAKGVERGYDILLEQPELSEKELLEAVVDKQATEMGLAEIMVFSREEIIAKNSLGFALWFEKVPSNTVLQAADNEEVVLLKAETPNLVRAVIKIHHYNLFFDRYVLVGRYIDPEIITNLTESKGSAAHYMTIWGDIKVTKEKLEVTFLVLSALMCISAVVLANKFANFIATPLERLVQAIASIKAGDFSVRLPEKRNHDEIMVLTKAFNVMTEHISQQRSELMAANELLDARRRFIEAILTELHSGVIVVTTGSEIILYNNAASKIFHNLADKQLKVVFPEVVEFVKVVLSDSETHAGKYNIEEYIVVNRQQRNFHLLVTIGVVMNFRNQVENVIIAFSDITELVLAQRHAMWADIARRIAHEIKNPLTPIHLAIYRLQRKYSAEIKSDPETFSRYIETISRNISEIEQMVNEFVEFARIPAPQFINCALSSIVNEALLLQKVAHPDIKYIFNEVNNYHVECDRGQVYRIFTNLLKNAAEAIIAKKADDKSNFMGKIEIVLRVENTAQCVYVEIYDNGKGIDPDLIEKVIEPYVSTKTSGTGLGLSIVKKLVMDNGGRFNIYNTKHGVCATFSLKLALNHCRL